MLSLYFPMCSYFCFISFFLTFALCIPLVVKGITYIIYVYNLNKLIYENI